MKSLLVLLALAGFGTAACGDDSGDNGTPEKDASTSIKDDAALAHADAAVARPQQIDTDKVGAACTAATAKTDCTGVGATCLTSSMLGDYPAGYCSATCEASAECGANGGCPIADLLSGFGGFGGLGSLGGLGGLGGGAATCYKKCTTKDECRAGYNCASLTSALSGLGGAGGAGGFDLGSLLGAAAKVTYCMPPVAIPDGGLPSGFPPLRDGGTIAVVRGMDAGT